MRRKIYALIINILILTLCCMSVLTECICEVSAASEYGTEKAAVTDNADLLSEDQEAELTQRISELRDKYAYDLAILTEDEIGNVSPMIYADDYYDLNGYGIGKNNDGMLLLINMAGRDYWTSTCGFGVKAFTDYGIDYIGNILAGYLSDGDYYGGFLRYIDLVDMFLKRANEGKPYDRGDLNTVPEDIEGKKAAVAAAIVIGAAVASTVYVLMLKSKMNTALPEPHANEYIKDGSFEIRKKKTLFLYSTVTRERIETESSSGSSTHMSSSGVSHGGGGGKF